MEIFVGTAIGYFKARAIILQLLAPQLICHDQQGISHPANEALPSFVNLYYNVGEQTDKTLWWPKLVEETIQSNPHRYTLLELFDWFGQLQTSMLCLSRTLLRMLRSATTIRATNYRREILSMTDGGTIALDWVVRDDLGDVATSNRPIVILLHGIVGDSQSEYLYLFCQELCDAGYQPVVMVARGCGGLELTSASLFAGTIAFDLYEAIHHLQERFGKTRKLFAVGYSLGAASLLTYVSLCKDRRPSGLTAAVCISPPWCFRQTILEPTFIGTFWSLLIALPLKWHFWQHVSHLRALSAEYKTISLLDVVLAPNVGVFDRICHHAYHKMDRSSITLPSADRDAAWIERGNRRYHSLEDYYHDTSPAYMVHDVDTPTLVVSAVDDPLCPHQFCPSPTTFSPHLVVVCTVYSPHFRYVHS